MPSRCRARLAVPAWELQDGSAILKNDSREGASQGHLVMDISVNESTYLLICKLHFARLPILQKRRTLSDFRWERRQRRPSPRVLGDSRPTTNLPHVRHPCLIIFGLYPMKLLRLLLRVPCYLRRDLEKSVNLHFEWLHSECTSSYRVFSFMIHCLKRRM